MNQNHTQLTRNHNHQGLLLLVCSALLFSLTFMPAMAKDIKLLDIASVDFTCGNNCRGFFRNTYSAYWSEGRYNNKQLEFEFREVRRHNHSIYLYDQSRDIAIRLDMRRKKVVFKNGKEPERDIYDIVSVKSLDEVFQTKETAAPVPKKKTNGGSAIYSPGTQNRGF